MAQVIDAARLFIDVDINGNQPSMAVNGVASYSSISSVVSMAHKLVGERESCLSLDLAGIEQIDTAALEGIADIANMLRRRNKRLRLENTSSPVRDILDKHLLYDMFCSELECCPQACKAMCGGYEVDIFSLPSSMLRCHEARARVSRVADAVGFNTVDLSDVLLAVGEAVANAVTHGNTGAEDDMFTVSCIATTHRLRVSISDRGTGFCLDQLPNIEDALFMEHGRGVHCMRAVMDEVSFCFERGTTVRMMKSGR